MGHEPDAGADGAGSLSASAGGIVTQVDHIGSELQQNREGTDNGRGEEKVNEEPIRHGEDIVSGNGSSKHAGVENREGSNGDDMRGGTKTEFPRFECCTA